jgi:hypothetical protein
MTDPVTTLFTTATTALQTELLSAGTIGIGVGVVIFAVGFGWRWIKGLIA